MQMRSKLLAALLLTVSACTRVGVPPASPPAEPVSPWAAPAPASLSGVATLGGQRLRVVVSLVHDTRDRGSAHLVIPELPLEADGTVTWKGDRIELDLRYGGACPGTLEIRAERVEEGPRFEGGLKAKDCTGEESGMVLLEVTSPPS